MFMFDYACCHFMGMHWEKTAEILEPLVKNDGMQILQHHSYSAIQAKSLRCEACVHFNCHHAMSC